MKGHASQKIRNEIRRLNRRLTKVGMEVANKHRALWGALALAQLDDKVTSDESDSADAEVALSDLLADLMHWCDSRKASRGGRQVAFDSALERAREYYVEERENELGRPETEA